MISRLDYRNALLAGAPDTVTKKLQRVQHMAARLIVGLRKYDHRTETMYDLHWLPVERRIQFKVFLLTYKALNGLALVYLSSLLVPYSSRRSNMQPHGNFLLQVPSASKATFGDRTFTAVAPV